MRAWRKECDFQKSLSAPESAYGFASKILLLHMSTTPPSSSHSSMVSEPRAPNGERWLTWDCTAREKDDIPDRCLRAVSLLEAVRAPVPDWVSSTCSLQQISAAGCPRMHQNQPQQSPAASTVRKTTQHLGHTLKQGLGGWKCCV